MKNTNQASIIQIDATASASKTILGLQKALEAAIKQHRRDRLIVAAFTIDGGKYQMMPNKYGIPLVVAQFAFYQNCYAREIRKDGKIQIELATSRIQWDQYWIECAKSLMRAENYCDWDYNYRPNITPIAMIRKGYIPLQKTADVNDPNTVWVECTQIAAISHQKNNTKQQNDDGQKNN